MKSPNEIARALGIANEPVAIVWTERKPEGALEFKAGTWGCVMWLFAKVAREGKTAVFSRETVGCAGGAMGLGFGRPFDRHAARSEEGFCSFLSNGIEGAQDRRNYEAIIELTPDDRNRKILTNGERTMKGVSTVRKFLNNLPVYDAGDHYIVMKPVSAIEYEDDVRSIVFVANADQLSALSILANYETADVCEGIVVAAGAAGCQAIGVCTYAGGERNPPRAVVGLTDLSARKAVRPLLGRDVLTFSVPYSLYLEMEQNVRESFLHAELWKELRDSA